MNRACRRRFLLATAALFIAPFATGQRAKGNAAHIGSLVGAAELSRELAEMKLDAVVTTCTPTTRAARRATTSTPIVMAAVADPVGQRLIASLARSGGDITELSSQAEDILPKMMELFSGVLPKPATIAVFAQGESDVHARMWQLLAPISRALNLRLVKIDVANAADLPAAFDRALRENANALFFLPDESLFLTRRGADR